ncbi:MAG TPA: thiol peroxidase [Kofleriaceae bacterium]
MDRFAVAVLFLAACSNAPSAPAAPPPPPERTDVINRGGAPLTLVGKTLDVGDPFPAVALADGKLQPVDLGTFKGKVLVLSVVPSIDTKVCESQTHHVNDATDLMPKGTVTFTISRDLPFAQTRFHDEAIIRHDLLSDYKGGTFGKEMGLEVKESGLLARSVWVIGTDGKVAYREIVADQGTEPNYDALVAAAKKASGG